MSWKIECDSLDDEDIHCLAILGITLLNKCEKGPLKFIGIPRGGIKLALKMQELAGDENGRPIVIDDVLTTGRNVVEAMQLHSALTGLVIFARRPCPENVYALFQLNWFLDLPSSASYDEQACDALLDGW